MLRQQWPPHLNKTPDHHHGMTRFTGYAAITIVPILRKRSIPETTQWNRQKGVSLLESVIGLLVLTIVLLAAAQFFRVHVVHLALVDRARHADIQANATMNTLAAYSLSALPDGNPFRGKNSTDPISDGEQITLDDTICLAQGNCDEIAKVPQQTGTGSDYTSIAWNERPPTNSSIVYYRAWRVTTVDAAKGLRRISLVILPVEVNKTATDPIEPLALRQTNVVQRQ